ncbi:MAG: hypothetical protein WAT39_00030 [Planctomycetota bacterium]
MRALALLLLLLLSFLGAGCTHYHEFRYANFDAAMAKPQQVKDPPVYEWVALPADLPSFVPYAKLHGDFSTASASLGSLRNEAIKRGFAPDFLLYEDQGSAQAGSTSTHVGFGVFVNQPTYRGQGAVWCCRLAPSSAGFRADNAFMVMSIEDEARVSGLQEGDTVLTLNGAEVKPPNQKQCSPWQIARFTVRPGDDIKVVWIRPGTGRMEGTFKALPPQPMTKTPSILQPMESPNRQRASDW